MWYVIFAILIFGFLIFIHEFGHFLAARLFGVKVNEFAIGMGPTLLEKQGKKTLYSLHLLPIGGYCAMEGENGDSDSEQSFTSKSAWKRLIILCAGAFMNFVTGVVILLVLYSGAQAFISPVLSGLMDGCPSAGYLEAGDEILKIDGKRVFLYSDISTLLNRTNSDTVDFTVRRNGEKIELKDVPCYLTEFETDSGTSMLYGFTFGIEEATPLTRISLALRQSAVFVRSVWYGLEDIVSGQLGIRDLSGPIGIVSTMSEVGESSETFLDAVENLFYLGALIAINLAVMNLLPLPALDGGRIFFIILNGILWLICRKKIPDKYESYVHTAGLLLLLALMAVVAVSDIMRIAGI